MVENHPTSALKVMKAGPGAYLRYLREDRGISIDELAGNAGTTFKTLQKIETGKTQNPNRGLILALLNTLSSIRKLTLVDRNQVLGALGYRDTFPLPESAEIRRFREQWEKETLALPHPACLVDCAYRIHAWNRYTPLMVGLAPHHPLMEQFRGKTLFHVFFDRSFSPAFTILNRDVFLFELLETMRSELEAFKEEDWCQQCIHEAKASYKEVRKHWEVMSKDPVRQLNLRMLGPIHLHPGKDIHLHFYLLGTDFLSDSRFRMIHYLPVDEITMHYCRI